MCYSPFLFDMELFISLVSYHISHNRLIEKLYCEGLLPFVLADSNFLSPLAVNAGTMELPSFIEE